jgi:serine protease AprX
MDAGTHGHTRARRRLAAAGVLAAIAAGALGTGSAAAAERPDRTAPGGDGTVGVIVEGNADAAAAEIRRHGGTVERRLPVVDGISATVPASALDDLAALPGVRSVTEDETLVPLGVRWGDDTTGQGLLASLLFGSWRADYDKSSVFSIGKQIGAHAVWDVRDPDGRGYLTGDGVGVALIDTGVSPVAGLRDAGKVVHGPDVSFDSQSGPTSHVDGYGHGTHMAGLIAGHDSTSLLLFRSNLDNPRNFAGMAPDAHIVNVKAGASDGAVDVSQVVAAIDWVVTNKDRHDIRVLNLSYGTDSAQASQLDPLAHAVQNAWRAGIVVVVAAGNDGAAGPAPLNMPAADPYVIAVGSADHNGSARLADWSMGYWTNTGTAQRRPDVLAPGKSVVSLRVPGSTVDTAFPEGRVHGDRSGRFFRGSGTSMSAAVVSGAVALLLQADPSLTPDQVKGLLTSTTDVLGPSGAPAPIGGINIKRAVSLALQGSVPAYIQQHARSTGLGSLEGARGSAHLTDPDSGDELHGEQDIFGVTWDAPSWAAASAAGTAWQGGTWRGTRWAGSSWSSGIWPTVNWTTYAWSGIPWVDRVWVQKALISDLLGLAGLSWAGNDDWTRMTWRESDWSRMTWRDSDWSRMTWRGAGW